jgi:hypothetical protein
MESQVAILIGISSKWFNERRRRIQNRNNFDHQPNKIFGRGNGVEF